MEVTINGRQGKEKKSIKYDPNKKHKLLLKRYSRFLTGVPEYVKKINLSKIKQAEKYKKSLIRRATVYETFLHEYLRTQKIMVDFQKIVFIVEDGRIRRFYILDIFLPKYNTIVEVDGKYHDQPHQKLKDVIRTSELKGLGYKVFRCTNEETFNVEKLHQRLITEGFTK